MTEFRYGIFKLLKKSLLKNSLSLAIVYTLGHIIIAMCCNYLITGASLDLAAIDAIVEPCINGVWFYVLHEAWKKINLN